MSAHDSLLSPASQKVLFLLDVAYVHGDRRGVSGAGGRAPWSVLSVEHTLRLFKLVLASFLSRSSVHSPHGLHGTAQLQQQQQQHTQFSFDFFHSHRAGRGWNSSTANTSRVMQFCPAGDGQLARHFQLQLERVLETWGASASDPAAISRLDIVCQRLGAVLGLPWLDHALQVQGSGGAERRGMPEVQAPAQNHVVLVTPFATLDDAGDGIGVERLGRVLQKLRSRRIFVHCIDVPALCSLTTQDGHSNLDSNAAAVQRWARTLCTAGNARLRTWQALLCLTHHTTLSALFQPLAEDEEKGEDDQCAASLRLTLCDDSPVLLLSQDVPTALHDAAAAAASGFVPDASVARLEGTLPTAAVLPHWFTNAPVQCCRLSTGDNDTSSIALAEWLLFMIRERTCAVVQFEDTARRALLLPWTVSSMLLRYVATDVVLPPLKTTQDTLSVLSRTPNASGGLLLQPELQQLRANQLHLVRPRHNPAPARDDGREGLFSALDKVAKPYLSQASQEVGVRASVATALRKVLCLEAGGAEVMVEAQQRPSQAEVAVLERRLRARMAVGAVEDVQGVHDPMDMEEDRGVTEAEEEEKEKEKEEEKEEERKGVEDKRADTQTAADRIELCAAGEVDGSAVRGSGVESSEDPQQQVRKLLLGQYTSLLQEKMGPQILLGHTVPQALGILNLLTVDEAGPARAPVVVPPLPTFPDYTSESFASLSRLLKAGLMLSMKKLKNKYVGQEKAGVSRRDSDRVKRQEYEMQALLRLECVLLKHRSGQEVVDPLPKKDLDVLLNFLSVVSLNWMTLGFGSYLEGLVGRYGHALPRTLKRVYDKLELTPPKGLLVLCYGTTGTAVGSDGDGATPRKPVQIKRKRPEPRPTAASSSGNKPERATRSSGKAEQKQSGESKKKKKRKFQLSDVPVVQLNRFTLGRNILTREIEVPKRKEERAPNAFVMGGGRKDKGANKKKTLTGFTVGGGRTERKGAVPVVSRAAANYGAGRGQAVPAVPAAAAAGDQDPIQRASRQLNFAGRLPTLAADATTLLPLSTPVPSPYAMAAPLTVPLRSPVAAPAAAAAAAERAAVPHPSLLPTRQHHLDSAAMQRENRSFCILSSPEAPAPQHRTSESLAARLRSNRANNNCSSSASASGAGMGATLPVPTILIGETPTRRTRSYRGASGSGDTPDTNPGTTGSGTPRRAATRAVRKTRGVGAAGQRRGQGQGRTLVAETPHKERPGGR